MQIKTTHLKNKLAGLIALSFAIVIALSNAAGPVATGHGGRTGASFDTSSCSSCHSGGTGVATVTIQLLSGTTPVTTYVPGVSYTLKLRVATGGISSLGYYYGLQAVCVQSTTNNDIAGWGALPAVAHSAIWNSRTYVEQSSTLHSTTYPTISIPWTAPASGTGDVIFYVGGCVVNNNSLPTGDVGATGSLTVTESAGCVPATLSATPTGVTCFGDGDGSINLTATGGTGAVGFAWTGPSGYSATTQNISGLSGGIYTVVVTSAGGCSDTTTVTVNENPAITATVTANSPVCPGATLSFTTTTTGGTGAGTYSYFWAGPNSFSSGIADPTATGFSAIDSGVYTFSILDANSCSFTTTIDVGLAPVPIVALGPDTTICVFDSIVLGSVLSGATYLWSTGATTATIAVHGVAGIYYVTVTSSAGCSASDTIHIATNPCEGSVKNVGLTSGINIYPNPANDFFTITTNSNNYLERISIYDVYGAKVYDGLPPRNNSKYLVDISRFAAGIYSVRIESEGNLVLQKLDITR